MSSSAASPVVEHAEKIARAPADPRQRFASLAQWLGREPSWVCVDPPNGVVHSLDQPRLAYEELRPLLREVSGGDEAVAVVDQEPLLVVAMPLPVQLTPGSAWVALDCYLTAPCSDVRGLNSVRSWVQDPDEFLHWAAGQSVTPPEMAMRLLDMATARLGQEIQCQQLSGEVEQLCEQLCRTYEEISLLYRLTHNLALNTQEEKLAATAVEWIGQILPAQGLAIYLPPRQDADAHSGHLWSSGSFPLDRRQAGKLVEYLKLGTQRSPCLLNHPRDRFPDWPFAHVQELIAVPIYESERFFGWMLAVNHTYGGEFGTSEVDLLQSISTILGIHRGNTAYYREQGELLTGIVRSLTSAIDAKDPYTHGHSDRVARVAVRLARRLGCDGRTVDTIYLAGLLHDIGKIGIDERVLRKPGRLTPEEFEHIKQHTIIGYEILQDIKQLRHVLPVVLHHHEAWDGSGYPHGLAGENIPFLARVVAVADAFDAMSSDRPYRKGMDDEKLDAVIRQGAGKQWDPRVVEAFFACREEIRRASRLSPEEDPMELRIWPSL